MNSIAAYAVTSGRTIQKWPAVFTLAVLSVVIMVRLAVSLLL